jgi:hypothetical protein
MTALFENYVLEVLGRLPADIVGKMQRLDLPNVLKTQATDWKAAIKETLHLSETIEIAIWDLWYTNQGVAQRTGVKLTGEEFAMGFVDNFLKEGSQVDVWTQETLAAAKERISRQRGTLEE